MSLSSCQRSFSSVAMPSMHAFVTDGEFRVVDNENARRLWAAVLERAILDLQERGTRAEAVEWVSSSRRGVGSFQWICQQLDMDPGSVRQALLRSSMVQMASKRTMSSPAQPLERGVLSNP